MRREVLFKAIRTEAGNIVLLLGGTEVGLYMPLSFWEKMAERLEKETKTSEYLDEEELAQKNKIAKIIRETLQKHQS